MALNRRKLIKGAAALAGQAALVSGGVMAVAELAGCGGGGGGGEPSVAAPSALNYASPVTATSGITIANLAPAVTGTVTSYSVAPALPAGLVIDSSTGVISGTPTAVSATATYVVTASNAGGSTNFTLSITIAAALSIVSVSNASPTALTPISVLTTGLDPSSPFTVSLSNSSGYAATLKPISTKTDGTVVVAAPLYLDPATGRTASLNATLQVSQGPQASNAVALAIGDIPASSAYSAMPGTLSRSFLNAQAIYFGVTLNALQVMRALPSSKTDTTTVQANVRTQQTNAIKARDNLDLLMSGSQSSLVVGTTQDGTQISFDTNSVDIMDRVVGMYLQSIGYLPSTIYPLSTAQQAFQQRLMATAASANTGRRRRTAQRKQASRTAPAAAAGVSLAEFLGTFAGAFAVKSAAVTANTAAAEHNGIDYAISIGQGVTAAALVAGTVLAVPELVAAATIVGTGYAVAAVGNDLYKIITASNEVDSAGDPAALAAAQQKLAEAKANITVDGIGAALGVFGFPPEVASELGVGADVVRALKFAQGGPSGITVQGAALVTSVAGLVVADAGAAAAADKATLEASNAEIPSAANSVAFVDGAVSISNANAPILWPLTGIDLKDGSGMVAVTTLADVNGDYQLMVPMGVNGADYSRSLLTPFDPVTGTDLSLGLELNLSSVNPAVPVNVPTLNGECTDDDASSPDEDDPDCD